MISIVTVLAALLPAHAQDSETCGVIESKESSTADYDEESGRVEISEVGSSVQRESGCEGACTWILDDPDNGDGQPVGKLVDIDNDQANFGDEIVANRVWYRTPDDLNDCIDVEAVVILDCDRLGSENATEGDSLRIVTESPYLEKCSVTGGGCIAPQGTGVQEAGGWLLLPLLGLVIRRREV